MEAERMPGDAEAAGAAASFVDLYGRRLERGQTVTYRRDNWPAGKTGSGTVLSWARGRVWLETDDDIVEIEVDELLS